ncbi:MAG: glycosyltransferase family 2 protein [Planctomycetes bacterium]|nr:glycosyltransferase family 2 protein [Planctomycetota bacterium]
MNNQTESIRPPCEETLLSVVLPVYNEARAIPILTARIAEVLNPYTMQYEIVFVDDGSGDESPRILDQLAASSDKIRVVHLSRNFGHQAAVQAGLAHARGNVVVLMDSDMQDDPAAIPRFMAVWCEGYDVVYAVRVQRKEGLPKRFLFTAFHRLMSAVASISIPAEAGIFGLIDRRVVQRILAMGESDRYFPGLRSWVGFRQKGIVVERGERYDNHPRVSLRGLFRLAKTAIFSFSSFPLTIFHFIGTVAAIVFLTLGGWALFCKLFTDLAIPGWTSYMLMGSFFGALNALGISILGEYVIRIYDQVRGRPQYVVDRTVNFATVEQAAGWHGHLARAPATTGETPVPPHSGDAPYVELLEQAEQLLQEGTISEKHRNTGIAAVEMNEPELFTLHSL